jgi:hypothetical protein
MPDHAQVPSSRSVFEVGKTYRMCGGGSATITDKNKSLLIGYTSPHHPYVRVWSLNGEFSPAARHFTIIPGEIDCVHG